MDCNHPVAIKMFELGCTNQKNILLAFQTYIELCEAYALKSVDYHYNSKLDMIYISSEEAVGKTDIYIPINVADSITLSVISQWQKEFIGDKTDIGLYVSLRDATSTGVYYKLNEGMSAPLSLQAAQVKKDKQSSKEFARAEIYKARSRIYQQAKDSVIQNKIRRLKMTLLGSKPMST